MIKSFKNILVLAPHTDDGELGAGGTIARLVESGSEVTYFAFSIARQSIPEGMKEEILFDEVSEATSILGIKKENLLIKDYPVRKLSEYRQEILEDLISLKLNNEFDLILTPSSTDVHQDHEVITKEAIRAFKTHTIFGYELIWNNLVFSSTAFVAINKSHLESKTRSLSKYISQKGRQYMSPQFIESLAHSRGTQIGVEYAEAFEVIRAVVK